MQHRPRRKVINLVFFDGAFVKFRLDEIWAILRHPYLMAFYVGVLALNLAVAALPVWGNRLSVPLNLRLPLASLSIATGLAVLVTVLHLLVWLDRNKAEARVHISMPLLVGILAGQCSFVLVQHLFLGLPVPSLARNMLVVAIYHGLAELFIALLLKRLAARILSDVRSKAAQHKDSAPAPARAQVQSGGQRFAVETLRHLSAEGNYVRIATSAGETLVPGPLSSIVAQIPDGFGAFVHRSDWVATRAVQAVQREGRNIVVKLHSGLSVRVASSRERELRDWLAQFPPPPRRRKSPR